MIPRMEPAVRLGSVPSAAPRYEARAGLRRVPSQPSQTLRTPVMSLASPSPWRVTRHEQAELRPNTCSAAERCTWAHFACRERAVRGAAQRVRSARLYNMRGQRGEGLQHASPPPPFFFGPRSAFLHSSGYIDDPRSVIEFPATLLNGRLPGCYDTHPRGVGRGRVNPSRPTDGRDLV